VIAISYLDLLADWLQAHDKLVKLVAVIATPGGLWFLIDKYRSRVRVLVRNVRLADSSMARIAFEAENVSSTVTSIEPTLRLTGYDVPNKKKVSYEFTVSRNARQLSPHVPVQFVVGAAPLANNPGRINSNAAPRSAFLFRAIKYSKNRYLR
jgi:hypothetical protein